MAASTHLICPVGDLPLGARKIVVIDGRSVGIFNVNGVYHALRNVCPHKLAPLCLGPVSGVPQGDRPGAVVLERAGEIVRCPWHGWEFEIATGKSVFNPHRVRVKTYPVSIESASAPACTTPRDADPDPSIETYSVSIQDDWVALHLK